MPRESLARRKERAVAVADALASAYPRSRCALLHGDPWQLLVATVLSAQTTDVAVNAVTPTLFARWPTPKALGAADPAAVGKAIDSIGLWRQKAKNIVALSRTIHAEHGGAVPQDMQALLALPGVGRKTATAVLGTSFGIAAGITVDTHMLRVNRLLGLTRETTADKVAADLERLLPPDLWSRYTHRIIDHGRLVCVARRPRCRVCPLQELCPSAFREKTGYRPENDEREPASARGLSWKAWEG